MMSFIYDLKISIYLFIIDYNITINRKSIIYRNFSSLNNKSEVKKNESMSAFHKYFDFNVIIFFG